MKNTKVWWKSKTVWFNFIMGLLPIVIDNLAVLKSALPDNVYGIILFTAIAGNAILRFVTSQRLAAK